MRVLFWSATFWPSLGGVEVLAAKLLPALRERGYEFTVLAPKTHPDLADEVQYKGIPVYRLPFGRAFNGSVIDHLEEMRKKVANLKRAFAPDLVHINAVGPANFFHLTTTNAHPAPVLVTLHQELSDETIGHDTLMGHLLGTADWVTACSAAVLSDTRNLVPEITPRSSLIYNALELPSLDPKPLSFDPPRLLCLGRLVHEKGFDLALAAFATIRDRFSGLHLVIAGDGPERAKLEQQVVALGLSDLVELTGWVAPEAVPALMNTATIVVMPSRWEEPFGLVALEAALMARPIVATHVGGLPEVVVHARTGLLVEPESSNALAKAVTYLLTHPHETTQIGEAARSRVQEVFSWERYVNAYDALYRKLTVRAMREGIDIF